MSSDVRAPLCKLIRAALNRAITNGRCLVSCHRWRGGGGGVVAPTGPPSKATLWRVSVRGGGSVINLRRVSPSVDFDPPDKSSPSRGGPPPGVLQSSLRVPAPVLSGCLASPPTRCCLAALWVSAVDIYTPPSLFPVPVPRRLVPFQLSQFFRRRPVLW